MFTQDTEQKQHFPLLTIVLIAVIFGFFSGIVGKMFYNAFHAPQIIEDLYESRRVLQPLIAKQDIKHDTIELIKDSIVGFYTQKTGDTPYTNAEFTGTGVSITEDGWVLTTKTVFKDNSEDYVVFDRNHTMYLIDYIVTDPATDAVFVRLTHVDPEKDITGMHPVNMGYNTTISAGENVFIFGYDQTIYDATVAHTRYIIKDTPSDLYTTSEEYAKNFLLQSILPESLLSSPMVDWQGNVVGMITHVGDDIIALPMRYITGAVEDILQNGEIHKPYLGVRYRDLTQSLQMSPIMTKGALVGHPTLRAVEKDSPAEYAEILAGDIITKVNREVINTTQSLAQIILRYNPEDVVTLTIVRDGLEQDFEVTLGNL